LIPIIFGDALGNSGWVGYAGLHDQYGILLHRHGAQVALHFHRAIEDFHSLHALVQIHSELRAALGGQSAKRRRHLQGLPEAGGERVKCGITLAKIHVIDLAAIGRQLQLRKVE
jgi:hypothetical protein